MNEASARAANETIQLRDKKIHDLEINLEGMTQNRDEWEARCLKAEAELEGEKRASKIYREEAEGYRAENEKLKALKPAIDIVMGYAENYCSSKELDEALSVLWNSALMKEEVAEVRPIFQEGDAEALEKVAFDFERRGESPPGAPMKDLLDKLRLVDPETYKIIYSRFNWYNMVIDLRADTMQDMIAGEIQRACQKHDWRWSVTNIHLPYEAIVWVAPNSFIEMKGDSPAAAILAAYLTALGDGKI